MKKAPQKLSGDSAVYLQIQGISSDNIKFLRGTEPFYNICPITVASCLNEQIGKTAKNKDDGESNMFAGDFAAIEKKGFSAYVRDLEKEKIEKIRKISWNAWD